MLRVRSIKRQFGKEVLVVAFKLYFACQDYRWSHMHVRLCLWRMYLWMKLRKHASLARSWQFKKNRRGIWDLIVRGRRHARISRGEHFARPSVHRTINFGHKALPWLLVKLLAPSLDANSPSELLTHMHLYAPLCPTTARRRIVPLWPNLPFDLV